VAGGLVPRLTATARVSGDGNGQEDAACDEPQYCRHEERRREFNKKASNHHQPRGHGHEQP
jgi:hypothetical protein